MSLSEMMRYFRWLLWSSMWYLELTERREHDMNIWWDISSFSYTYNLRPLFDFLVACPILVGGVDMRRRRWSFISHGGKSHRTGSLWCSTLCWFGGLFKTTKSRILWFIGGNRCSDVFVTWLKKLRHCEAKIRSKSDCDFVQPIVPTYAFKTSGAMCSSYVFLDFPWCRFRFQIFFLLIFRLGFKGGLLEWTSNGCPKKIPWVSY